MRSFNEWNSKWKSALLLFVTLLVLNPFTTFWGGSRTVYADAAAVFQADFKGSGGGTGGPSDLVTQGGTGTLTATGSGASASVLSAPDMGSGSFVRFALPAGLTTAKAQFTPSSPANSLAALWSKPGSQALLNGAIDFLFRSAEGITSGSPDNAFRPIDTNNTANGGLRLILSNIYGNQIRLQINDSAGIIGYNQAVFNLSPNTVYHLGFTFSTDASTGVTTAKMFAVAGTGAINTSGTPLYSFTFNMNESRVSQGFTSGAFDFGMFYGTQGASRTQDFDRFRIFSSAPAQM